VDAFILVFLLYHFFYKKDKKTEDISYCTKSNNTIMFLNKSPIFYANKKAVKTLFRIFTALFFIVVRETGVEPVRLLGTRL